MSTSKKSYDQVKDILRKLDASIDEARSRRLQTQTPSPAPAGPQGGQSSGPDTLPPDRPGRATPINRPPESNGSASAIHRRVG